MVANYSTLDAGPEEKFCFPRISMFLKLELREKNIDIQLKQN